MPESLDQVASIAYIDDEYDVYSEGKKMDNRDVLNEIKGVLRRKHGRAIDKVILYGSRADGTAGADSDYDVLIIVNGPQDWRLRRRISSACYDVDLKFDILTDVKVISADELNTPKGRQPFIVSALENGIAA